MDPAQKKWLRNLIVHISENFTLTQTDSAHLLFQRASNSTFVDSLLHATGLAFGYPAGSIFKEHALSKEWDEADKAKIYFTESLLACYLRHQMTDIALPVTPANLASILMEAVESIATFYSQYKPAKKRQHLIDISRIFRSDSSTISKVEQTINDRLKPIQNLNSSYWHSSRYHVFIFLDLIFYAEWLKDRESTLYNRETLIKHEIVKVVAVSIANSMKADKKVEKGFFNYLIENVIDDENVKALRKIENKKIPITSISVGTGWPDIIRLMLFEYGIFTLILDKTIDNQENDYINRLAEHLGIDSQQKEIRILAVSSFIYKNLSQLHYLKNQNVLDIVSSNLSRRLGSIIIKNKGKIGREIAESKELAELLWKAKSSELTKEEREKVRRQLLDISLRIIPSLAIVMVPGGTVLLPLLLKILPEEILLPSSFRNK